MRGKFTFAAISNDIHMYLSAEILGGYVPHMPRNTFRLLYSHSRTKVRMLDVRDEKAHGKSPSLLPFRFLSFFSENKESPHILENEVWLKIENCLWLCIFINV